LTAHLLVCCPPATGHVNPTLAIVAELARRGHRVSYPTTEDFAARVAEAGARPILYRSTVPSAASEVEWPVDHAGGLALFLGEAEAVVPWELTAFDEDRPDLVLYDLTALGGRILARHWDVPAIQLSPVLVTPLRVHRDFNRLMGHKPAWIAYRARFRRFLDANGISLDIDEYVGDPQRCVVMIPREFQPSPDRVSDRHVFVGPCLRAGDPQSSWDPPPPGRRVVYVSLGSCYANQPDFYRECIAAFGRLEPWHVVLSVGTRVDPAGLGELPPNVDVYPSVPQLEVLRRASAFITHGGTGSVLEALANAVPMVVVPQAVDHPANARQVLRLGLGRALAPERVTADALREAVLAISGDPEVAGRLAAMRRRIAGSGGGVAAADVVEESLARELTS
jgi:MGT family glycosyltransferase